MSASRQKFLTVLSKWPITFPKKEYDYAYRLRELVENKSEAEEIFPGTAAENMRKLDALVRLINNTAKSEFEIKADSGASGFKLDEIKDAIQKQIESGRTEFLSTS